MVGGRSETFFARGAGEWMQINWDVKLICSTPND